jgi:hypothetical protein
MCAVSWKTGWPGTTPAAIHPGWPGGRARVSAGGRAVVLQQHHAQSVQTWSSQGRGTHMQANAGKTNTKGMTGSFSWR